MSEPKRILIVEDVRLIAADLEGTLRRMGYGIAGNVASGEEAIPKALEVRPDLVLMDIRLRGQLDGIQAAEAIRAQMDVPVVFLTAYADEHTILRARAAAPFGYVVKPFNERELRATLEVALAKNETDRLLTEERELRKREAQFRQLAEAVPQMVWIADASGEVGYLNQRWSAYTGLPLDELLRKNFEGVLHPDDATSARAAWRECVRTGEPYETEYRLKREGDGEYRWFLVRAVPVRDEIGAVVRWFGSATDIHEAKEAQRRLVEAIELRDDFLSIAGHELKTPLAAMLLHLQSLRRAADRTGVPAREQERLDKTISAGLRLEQLIHQLLDVSRIQSGRLQLAPERMDLVALVREVVARQADAQAKTGTPVEVRSPPSLWGEWDRGRIDQVLTNLLGNALKYGKGRPVAVEVGEEGGEVVLRVVDHGIGIAKDQQERIFQRFERAVATREYGGFGLGLWISRRIVEAMGGRIEVESKPGEGSTFTVRWPARGPERAHGL